MPEPSQVDCRFCTRRLAARASHRPKVDGGVARRTPNRRGAGVEVPRTYGMLLDSGTADAADAPRQHGVDGTFGPSATPHRVRAFRAPA
ncbi:hypothetical protein PTE31013_01009 [Pandoraea terrigena]|uniref:Uncharacterized protein n=1 Tax=Pandoraea terrigena TaxID=2508292 RepID=A0A5E4SVP8_9BURK|nr:hypothetical protein PTE31013_01009 [Pandoraea terrigena]